MCDFKGKAMMIHAINAIKQASLHKGASTGEVELAEFLKSCLGFKTDVTIKDVLFRLEPEVVCEVIGLANAKQLKGLIKEMNPKLYDDIFS